MLDFVWDDDKAAANHAKHGVRFADAVAVFDDPFALDIEDRSMDYGELRRRVVGIGTDCISPSPTPNGARRSG